MFLNSTQSVNASGGIRQFAATRQVMRAIADNLWEEVDARGVRVPSIFPGRTANDRQRPMLTLLSMLTLPRTAEARRIALHPMQQ